MDARDQHRDAGAVADPAAVSPKAARSETNPALSACWHPVAYSHQLGAVPVATTLLGEPIVLWRDGNGAARAFRDLCIHRGTALSLGRVEGGELICAYHGWRYGGDGRCTHIPQLEDPTRVPEKARAIAYPVQRRYGLVWVAMKEARWPLAEVPELESPDWIVVATGPFEWRCDASRQIENFTDLGHFPFVHPGLLGDPSRPVVPHHEVRTEGHVLYYDVCRPEAPATEDFPVFANPNQERPERRSRYQLHLPYTIVVRLGWGGASGMVYFFASQPVATDRCVGYCIIARNYNKEQPDSVLQDFESVIFGQDQIVVESQRPEQVPFDLAAELHLKFDAIPVGYRRAMKANGLS